MLAPRADDSGRIVVKGRVIDYTGAALVLETPGGGKQTLPGRQVVEVRSTWNADQAAGDDAWRRRDHVAAATKFESAYAAETRPWARRLIQSKLVAALREQGRWEPAAEQFLSLVRDDPATPYFDVAPLVWTTTSPPASLEGKARAWLADRTSNVATLLACSYLLSTPSRGDALRRLRELTLDGDPRIALLAEAQLWRAAAVAADAAQVANWEKLIDGMPDPLRAGPYLVVGRAWGRLGESERAAVALLRVPILHPEQHALAAEALWSAGQMLEKMSQTPQAARLYRELVRDYPHADVAGPAKDRLADLESK